jgi:5-methylcytosine-specific restriction endonuclease McrA
MTLDLMNEKAIRERFMAVYRAMKHRARPRYWQSGQRKGKLKTPGIVELPFTRDQLWSHIVQQIGKQGAIACPYCREIGRPAHIIGFENCVLDHKVPIDRGGTWDLSNIVCVCADCNNAKGHLSYEFFIAIMSEVEKWPDAADRRNFNACLRTHGVANRLRFHGKKPAPAEPQDVAPTLALKEEW